MLDSIEDKLFVIAHENQIPLDVDIELLTKCNMRCRHCYIPSHTSDGLPFDVLMDIFMQLRKLGTMNLTLTGGEIFLRKDILDIIKAARTFGFRVTLLTNASLLNDELITELKKLHINMLGISLYSLNEVVYNSITQTNNLFHRVVNNILKCKQAGISVRINTPLMNLNKDFNELEKFCKTNGFIFNVSQVILPKTNGDNSNQNLAINENDFETLNVRLFEREHTNLTENSFNMLELYPDEPCPTLKTTLLIDSSGDVYPCSSMHFKVGNIYQEKLRDIIFNDALQNIRNIKKSELVKCSTCEMKQYCSRCPGLIYEESRNLYGCSKTVKAIAASYLKYKKEVEI